MKREKFSAEEKQEIKKGFAALANLVSKAKKKGALIYYSKTPQQQPPSALHT